MIREALDYQPAETDNWTDDGLALLTAMIGSEIFATASRVQADAFFAAVGRRIAALLQVGDISDEAAIMSRINRLWQTLGWGETRLEMTENAIMIHHQGLPETLQGDIDGRWADMAPALLCGAYDAWLHALGSAPHIRTSVVRWRGGVMDLRHGG